MSLFSSLTNRIFVASALLAVVSIAVGIYNVNLAVTSQAERDLRRGLNEARTLIEENQRILVEHFTREARLIADLPRLKAAVEVDDGPTVQPVVDEFQQQLGADLFIVTNRHGVVLARQPQNAPIAVDGLPGVARAVAGREASTFVAHPGGILQVVSVPIWITPEDPEIYGTLSIGFSLDRHAANRFRSLTNSDIAFGMGDAIQSSTLSPSGWAVLAPLLRREGLTQRVWLDGSEYIAMTVPLSSDGASVEGVQRIANQAATPTARAIILRSRTERLFSFLTPLHTSLLLTAVLVVLAATGLSYGIARTVTRPLGTITATMREMAATGDLTRRIPLPANPRWEDEDARLLASTFNQMTESIARFQREAAQRERLSSLGRLSTVVAHEIRNPLMIIKSALRGLRRDGVSADELRTAVGDIDEEIVRLNRLVSEVLDFAKPIKFEMAPADVAALCADAVKASEAGAPPLPIAVRRGPMPAIATDAERLRLVLVNLLSNARQAVMAREGAASLPDPLVVSAFRQGDVITIEVRDRGIGIAADDLPRIFDPYFTTRRTGTGLGLAISRNIVEGLGGTIAVESRHGHGTSVRIVLPIR